MCDVWLCGVCVCSHVSELPITEHFGFFFFKKKTITENIMTSDFSYTLAHENYQHLFGRNCVGNHFGLHGSWVPHAAQQFEQAARDLTHVSPERATAQQRSGTVSELLSTEQKAEQNVSEQTYGTASSNGGSGGESCGRAQSEPDR